MSASALEGAARALAAGEVVLAAGVDGSGATVGAAATLIGATGLASLYELGGDLAVLALGADHAARLGLTELPQATRPRGSAVRMASRTASEI